MIDPATAPAPIPAAIDASDPVVMILSWLIVMGVTRFCAERPEAQKIKHFAPLLAVFIAVAIRTAGAAAQGQPITFDVVVRAALAGAVAVFAHSQLREVNKLAIKTRTAKAAVADHKSNPEV
jgi:hypothetical protein